MLELKNLCKAFDQTLAVQNVNLEVKPGEFFSILGPSGCGKTTLLRMISGIEAPSKGELSWNGQRLNDIPAHERQFNLVFQKYALFPHLDVFENIAFGLRIKKLGNEEISSRVKEILSLVRMEEYSNRKIQTLSGGQAQRIALARALVNRPRVVLLDEPLSALDLKLRKQMQFELRELQKNLKCTFILVTHDQDEALSLSDRIAVMNEGKIEQIGTPEEVYENPTSLFVANFLGSINGLQVDQKSVWIRPEKITVFLKDLPLSNQSNERLSFGKIDDLIFQGSQIQMRVSLEFGKITVLIPALHAGQNFKRGQECKLLWKLSDERTF